jgi:hypothetical protein
MNSFALITAITLAADFSLAAASIARARMVKALRKSATAFAAFAIATSFIASSFADEFTVHQGKRYRATLSLSSVERLVDNASIAQKFRAARLHERARFGLGLDAQGGRRVAGQGHEHQHAPADRGCCQVVRAAARLLGGGGAASARDKAGRSGGRRSQRRRCRVRARGRRPRCL